MQQVFFSSSLAGQKPMVPACASLLALAYPASGSHRAS
jgi:hypothetical protein